MFLTLKLIFGKLTAHYVMFEKSIFEKDLNSIDFPKLEFFGVIS